MSVFRVGLRPPARLGVEQVVVGPFDAAVLQKPFFSFCYLFFQVDKILERFFYPFPPSRGSQLVGVGTVNTFFLFPPSPTIG